MASTLARRVNAFWFRDFPNPMGPVPLRATQLWFSGQSKLEQARTDRFLKQEFLRDFEAFESEVNSKEAGPYCALQDDPEGALSLVLMSGFFTRAMFRGEARAFAFEERTRELAWQCVEDEGHFHALGHIKSSLFLWPLLHIESEYSAKSVVTYLTDFLDKCSHWPHRDFLGAYLKVAKEHYRVLQAFHRYPTRNEALGRESTELEKQYLKHLRS